MDVKVNELPQEYQLLLRDLKQAARTVLDVRGKKKFALGMFLLVLREEAMQRTGGRRAAAAQMIGEHRNSFTRGIPEEERKMRERFAPVPRPVLEDPPRQRQLLRMPRA